MEGMEEEAKEEKKRFLVPKHVFLASRLRRKRGSEGAHAKRQEEERRKREGMKDDQMRRRRILTKQVGVVVSSSTFQSGSEAVWYLLFYRIVYPLNPVIQKVANEMCDGCGVGVCMYVCTIDPNGEWPQRLGQYGRLCGLNSP